MASTSATARMGTLEVSNVGSSMMLVTSSSRGRKDASLAVSSVDGLEIVCSVIHANSVYPCVVAAFGASIAESTEDASIEEHGSLAFDEDGCSSDGDCLLYTSPSPRDRG